MAGTRVLRQDDFTGGLNLRADQFQLAANESPRMLNVEIDPRGGVFSRGAMRSFATAITATNWNPERLFSFYADTHYLMLSTGKNGMNTGEVFYSTGGSFTPLLMPVSDEHGAAFAPWGKEIYVATGVDSLPYKWDGTTKTTLTVSGGAWQNSYTAGLSGVSMPKAKLAVTHAGKLFVANTYEDGAYRPNRIRWSHPNSPGNWAYEDYIDINNGASGITGLAVFAGHLVVFKKDSVFAVFGYDSDTFQVVEISRHVGTPTSHSFAVTERGVYFFSYPDGLMLYNGERVIDLFEAIRPAIQSGYINPNAVDEVYVSNINRRIWVSVPYDENSAPTHPTVSFVYDPSISQRGAWLMFSTYDGFGASGGCTFTDTNGLVKHAVAHPTVPSVLAVDLYNNAYDMNNGVTNQQFESRYRTRWLDAGSYSQQKMFRRPDVILKQNAAASILTIKAYGDYEEADSGEIKQYDIQIPASGSGLTWGTGVWGSSWGAPNTGSQIISGRSIGLAKSVQLEFVGSPGKSWGVNSYTLKYNPRRMKV
jgi:hypothetical protein